MKNDQSKRLIEHIGDQYVSLAADPVEAFTAIRETKTRGRLKLWTATAACALLSILITVVMLSGVLDQADSPAIPDDPSTPGSQPEEPDQPGADEPGTDEPGTDEPGTDEPDEPVTPPDEPSYSEPEITLPDFKTFAYHIRGFWTSNWYEGWENINYLFNFQYNGHVYILNLDTKEAEIGRYSFTDDKIELFTLTDGVGWEKSDITMQLNRAETKSETKITITKGKYTETYIRIQLNTVHLSIKNLKESVAIEAFSIEEMTLFEPYDPYTVSYELPSLEHVKTLDVHQFSSAPTTLRFSSIFNAEYRIYDKHLELIAEGECATAPDSEFAEIEFPEEDGLYYLEVIADDLQNELFDSLILHFYAAIQVGEPDEPVTPPDEPTTPPTPEISTPSLNFFYNHMSSTWGNSRREQSHVTPYMFVFQPDGRLYIFNHHTGEAITGLYSLADVEAAEAWMNSGKLTHESDVDVWLQDEEGEWYLSDISITISFHAKEELCYLNFTIGDTAEQAYRGNTMWSPRLAIYSGDGSIKTERKGLYNYYYEEIELLGAGSPVVVSFGLPAIEKGSSFVKMLTDSACNFTKLPNASQVDFWWQTEGYYKLYDSNCRLIAEGECDLTPNTTDSGFDVPNVAGLYYLDICVEDYYNPTPDLLAEHKIHFYVAFRLEDSIPATPYQPPKETTLTVPIFDCDTLPSNSGVFTLDKINKTEGAASLSLTADQETLTILFHTFAPMNAEGCDVLEFDMYVSDAELFKNPALLSKYFTIELSSGGQVDMAEINFYGKDIIEKGLAGQELKSGWNHVVIRLCDGEAYSLSNEVFDVNSINFLRIYLIGNSSLPEGEHTIKFDNICLSKEVK